MDPSVAFRPKPLPRLLRDKAARAFLDPRDYLVRALASAPTNAEAARTIGVTRSTLYRWCRLLGVTVEIS